MTGRLARWLGTHWARLSYARHVEPTWLDVPRVLVPVPGLPDALAGLTVAHLSDLHVGRQLPEEYLSRVIDTTLDARPDLIALTGDFIHHGYKHVEPMGVAVARLRAPLGVWAVLGNHDFSVRNALGVRRHPGLHAAIADRLTLSGVRVLRNEAVTLTRDGATLALVGLDDLWSRECDPVRAFAGLPESGPRLVLAHNPQTARLIADRRWELMLSGHTHGGQVDWPGLGRVVLGKAARELAAGLYPLPEGRCVYVSTGVGFGLRFRFGVRPEVAILTLAPAQSAGPIPD